MRLDFDCLRWLSLCRSLHLEFAQQASNGALKVNNLEALGLSPAAASYLAGQSVPEWLQSSHFSRSTLSRAYLQVEVIFGVLTRDSCLLLLNFTRF